MDWRKITENDLDLTRDVIEACIAFYKETQPQAKASINALETAKTIGLPDFDEIVEEC